MMDKNKYLHMSQTNKDFFRCIRLMEEKEKKNSFQGGTSVVVPKCYMLYLYVYGLQQYGQLKNSCPLCFLFCSVL